MHRIVQGSGVLAGIDLWSTVEAAERAMACLRSLPRRVAPLMRQVAAVISPEFQHRLEDVQPASCVIMFQAQEARRYPDAIRQRGLADDDSVSIRLHPVRPFNGVYNRNRPVVLIQNVLVHPEPASITAPARDARTKLTE